MTVDLRHRLVEALRQLLDLECCNCASGGPEWDVELDELTQIALTGMSRLAQVGHPIGRISTERRPRRFGELERTADEIRVVGVSDRSVGKPELHANRLATKEAKADCLIERPTDRRRSGQVGFDGGQFFCDTRQQVEPRFEQVITGGVGDREPENDGNSQRAQDSEEGEATQASDLAPIGSDGGNQSTRRALVPSHGVRVRHARFLLAETNTLAC